MRGSYLHLISNTALHITFLSLLEILPMSSITKTKILPTMTGYKLRITSNWSKHKKNGYCRMNTIYYLKRLLLELNDRWHLLEKRDLHGSWLTALPIKTLGYTLNKREFQDSICLRYDWRIPNKPSYCLCGVNNDINHALSCKKGGYVMMRHNCIRNLEAEIMQEVCSDVRIEPETCHLTTT